MAHAISPSDFSSAYFQPRRPVGRRQVFSWAAVILVHVIGLGALIFDHTTKPKQPDQTITVSFIAEQRPMTQHAPEPVHLTTPALTLPPVPIMPPVVTPIVEEAAQKAPPQPATPSAAPSSSAPTTPPNFTAAYLNNPGPSYPMASRRQREEGVVLLKVLVNADGTADQVLVDQSSGFPNLDAAAVDVVKKRWRFVPAKQNGTAVAAWVEIPMSFELKNR